MLDSATSGIIEGTVSALAGSYIIARFGNQKLAKNFKSFLISSILIAYTVMSVNHLWGLSNQPIIIGLLLSLGFHLSRAANKQKHYLLASSACFLAVGFNLYAFSEQNIIWGCSLIVIGLLGLINFFASKAIAHKQLNPLT